MKVMVFDVDLANCIGVDEAIIVSQMKYWIDRTEHVYDERKWVYNTIESWSEQFSFWSKDKVFRLLKKLQDEIFLLFIKFFSTRKKNPAIFDIPPTSAAKMDLKNF